MSVQDSQGSIASSELVEQLVGLGNIDQVLSMDVVLLPSLIEICFDVVLALLSREVPESFQHSGCALKGLSLGDHFDSIFTVLGMLIEEVL